VSSCDWLLKNKLDVAVVAAVSVLGLLGNAGSVLSQCGVGRGRSQLVSQRRVAVAPDAVAPGHGDRACHARRRRLVVIVLLLLLSSFFFSLFILDLYENNNLNDVKSCETTACKITNTFFTKRKCSSTTGSFGTFGF
jgi:hypothetical protein